jgi:squalene-hopene/tetraprenyl-beta-curcumene cyclase
MVANKTGTALAVQPPLAPPVEPSLDEAIQRAADALLALQHPDGYWSFEFEADCTIPAEYILMMHYMGEVDPVLQAKLAVYLRARQNAAGGWSLYPGGGFDLSCSVKTYYALKLAGDDPEQPHMACARAAILARGGAARCNVFSRITLALFGQLPWRAVPFMPVEIMLLPRWFPFHFSKVSYWSRTVMVPLLILCTLKPQARNFNRVGVRELFTIPPERERDYFPVRSWLNRVFLLVEGIARWLEPLLPAWLRRRALERAERWFTARLNGRGGLGAIFPAMVNAYEALDCLGYPADHPDRLTARQALQDLLVIGEHSAYCQPCVSPVWDTGLACLALQEALGSAQPGVRRGLDWLQARQLLEAPGDWRESRPELKGGGWPFQFENDYYPDLDDTAVVAWAMDQERNHRYRETIYRAADWLCGMQSRNGGFASFGIDNTQYYLNEIPFADHGALLDPPTADVSARCAALLARLFREKPSYQRALQACLDYLRREQEPGGSWFGRWGTNYIYGTWSVLVAFQQAGIAAEDPAVRRAVEWLESVQRADGGWGEDNDSYEDPGRVGQGQVSTAFQTAWAVLALLAAGRVGSVAVRRGVAYLLRAQRDNGLWQDDTFTAPGFPRVFYLKYHGYDKYFPLWALARYRALQENSPA